MSGATKKRRVITSPCRLQLILEFGFQFWVRFGSVTIVGAVYLLASQRSLLARRHQKTNYRPDWGGSAPRPPPKSRLLASPKTSKKKTTNKKILIFMREKYKKQKFYFKRIELQKLIFSTFKMN